MIGCICTSRSLGYSIPARDGGLLVAGAVDPEATVVRSRSVAHLLGVLESNVSVENYGPAQQILLLIALTRAPELNGFVR